MRGFVFVRTHLPKRPWSFTNKDPLRIMATLDQLFLGWDKDSNKMLSLDEFKNGRETAHEQNIPSRPKCSFAPPMMKQLTPASKQATFVPSAPA